LCGKGFAARTGWVARQRFDCGETIDPVRRVSPSHPVEVWLSHQEAYRIHAPRAPIYRSRQVKLRRGVALTHPPACSHEIPANILGRVSSAFCDWHMTIGGRIHCLNDAESKARQFALPRPRFFCQPEMESYMQEFRELNHVEIESVVGGAADPDPNPWAPLPIVWEPPTSPWIPPIWG